MIGRIIGVDIGGTKIHVGVVENSVVVKELKIPTPSSASKQHIIAALITAIEELAGSNFDGIGIGVPGLVDDEKGIIYNLVNIPSWKEVHLKKQLEEHFGKPVRITNDANAFALGEKIFGKAKPFRNVVGITLGSGLGAGIIINNKLYSGAFSSAGELGGVSYLNETVEDYCSGKFFINFHQMTGQQLHEMAQRGDETALRIFSEYGHHLGNALTTTLFLLSPEAIIFGGSVSRSFQYFEKALLESLDGFPFKNVRNQLVVSVSENLNTAILGSAALLVSEQYHIENLPN